MRAFDPAGSEYAVSVPYLPCSHRLKGRPVISTEAGDRQGSGEAIENADIPQLANFR